MEGRWTFTTPTARVSSGSPRARTTPRSAIRRPTLRRFCDWPRECHDDGVALAVFPELTLSGYSIEDIVLQDSLLDAVEAATARHRRGLDRVCCRCWWSVRRCAIGIASTTPLSSSTAASCSAWRPSRTCPPTGSSTSAARSHRETTSAAPSGSATSQAPFGPDLLFAASDVPGFVLHVEICEDMFVPVPPSAEAALGGRDGAGQPVRQPDHDRPRRGPLPAGPLGVVAVPGRLRLRRRGRG